jgi:hypothetical protein
MDVGTGQAIRKMGADAPVTPRARRAAAPGRKPLRRYNYWRDHDAGTRPARARRGVRATPSKSEEGMNRNGSFQKICKLNDARRAKRLVGFCATHLPKSNLTELCNQPSGCSRYPKEDIEHPLCRMEETWILKRHIALHEEER